MITEIEIINRYLKSLTFNNKNALKLNDDVYLDLKKKIVFSTDTYEEKIHFLNAKKPKTFVKKVFRSAISDIICKGSKPLTYFLSLSIKKINKKWLNDFTNILNKESKKYGLFLGGGDTVKSNKFSITISVLGVIKKKPVLRSNAKPGDDIYVTGNLGDSFFGLLSLQKKINLGKFNYYFLKAYEEPNLPVKFSYLLYKFASSSIDISDGLINDLRNICKSSKCGAFINISDLPFSSYAKKIFKMKRISPIEIFSKGDDYQVLFTAKKKYRKIISSASIKTSTKVTRVGKVTTGNTVITRQEGKKVILPSTKSGYIHTFD